MEPFEHAKKAKAAFWDAIHHAQQGVDALRRWDGGKTWEHPLGAAHHWRYLGLKQIGMGVAHMESLDRDGEMWAVCNELRNTAEHRHGILHDIIWAAGEFDEDWPNQEKKWSDVTDPMRTAEPWIFGKDV